jgi:hypothetical protein
VSVVVAAVAAAAAAAAFVSEPESAFTEDKENRDANLVEPVDVFVAGTGSLSSSAPFPEFFSLGSFDENLLKKLRADGFSVAATAFTLLPVLPSLPSPPSPSPPNSVFNNDFGIDNDIFLLLFDIISAN